MDHVISDIAPAPIRDALQVLDELGDTTTATEVRAIRDRASAIAVAHHADVEAAADLRSDLAARLADGEVTFEQAGNEVHDLERRRHAVELGRGLVADVIAELTERLHPTARAVGDGWIVAMRPAVVKLSDALTAAAKLSDGALLDVRRGNGTPSQRAAVQGVRDAWPTAERARDVATALVRAGFVPAATLPEGVEHGAHYVEAGLNVDGYGRDQDGRDQLDRRDERPKDTIEYLIWAHREFGWLPALRNPAEAAELPSGATRSAERARLRAVETEARAAEGQRRADEVLAASAR